MWRKKDYTVPCAVFHACFTPCGGRIMTDRTCIRFSCSDICSKSRMAHRHSLSPAPSQIHTHIQHMHAQALCIVRVINALKSKLVTILHGNLWLGLLWCISGFKFPTGLNQAWFLVYKLGDKVTPHTGQLYFGVFNRGVMTFKEREVFCWTCLSVSQPARSSEQHLGFPKKIQLNLPTGIKRLREVNACDKRRGNYILFI